MRTFSAAPKCVAGLNECYFYHTMDIPGHGIVQGDWDLRKGVRKYLGNGDVAGKRVLDVETSSGFSR